VLPRLTALPLIVLLGVAGTATSREPSKPRESVSTRAESTVVILLGTGVPRPDPDASGPATAIVVGARVFLFDAGAGVMRRVSAAGLPTNGVTALFFTHLHSDHTLGYPDVIFTTWLTGRHRPLEVYGPHGLSAMTDHILAAWKADIDVRTNGLEHESPNGYAVHVHEISSAVVYDSGGVKITAIPVLHGSWPEAFGYRIDTPDRSIVISGDTRPAPSIERAARGVDVLIHEVYPEGAARRPDVDPAEWAKYMRAFHTSDAELGRLAAAANPKLLIIYHFGARAMADAVIAAIHREGFQGRVVVGKDLDRF